ncbi:MAG: substrate-binding domain-containing protein [Anaerolineae bacterium]|nr:substrate-binding domain-containing protein [Anaerolineae bacterium]
MKRAKCTLVILSLALASCRGPAYAPTVTPQTVSVRLLSTTTAYPLLQDLTTAYHCPGVLLAVHSVAANWETVYSRLLAGEAPFALTTFLPPNANLWAAPIGQDGIAIIVHIDNMIPSLTAADLRRVFQGQVTLWNEIGGPELPITVVSREDGADTRLVFESLVMGQRRTTLSARLALSSQGMVDIVASLPGAVGYVSMAKVDDRVRVVPVAARQGEPPLLPSPETVGANVYPLRAPIFVVGPDPPDAESAYWDLFAWMQSQGGQAVVGQRYGALLSD